MIRILDCNTLPRSEIFARPADDGSARETVAAILAHVAREGDAAVKQYTQQFDGSVPAVLELSPAQVDMGFRDNEPQFLDILFEAADRIANFHKHQLRDSFWLNEEKGVLMGQKVLPLERVGLYVPGGTAAYPSSVLMNCIPAKLAGVKEIVMVSPPTGGKIPSPILAAAKVAGVDRVFQVGGAQAVAALAYGTQTIPKVDKIVGPGNRYVAEAKRQVYGLVDIDMIAGPSEILILADGTCNPTFVAADLLSQAEHDTNASAVLVTDSPTLAQAVAQEVEAQLLKLPRQEIARASIENNGKILLVQTLEEGIQLANEIAPEHLELCVDNPFDYLDQIKHAGSVFLGKNCPEALGDYFAGPNHTLPTSGTARFASPLSVDDFVKKMQVTYFTAEALKKVSRPVSLFARQEGLQAHARSVELRQEEADQ